MAVRLSEGLQAQIRALQAEKTRLQEQAVRDVASVDAKMAALASAARVVTPEVEAAYTALVQLGLISEITR